MDIDTETTFHASSSADQHVDERPEETIENGETLLAYRAAAAAVNDALLKVAQQAVIPGKKVVDLCEMGDKLIEHNTATFNRKKKLARGVAFPTCVNVGSIVSHNSPLEDDTAVIREGDVIRIDMGAHVDGYIAVAATTIVASSQPDQVVLQNRRADALAAAEKCLDAAMRLMKPGHTNTDVSIAIAKITNDFGVEACEGVLSHELKRWVIDGNRVILQKPTSDQSVEEFEFKENQVFALDICISTGSGKLREAPMSKPCIYKRNPEQNVDLKRQSSRQVLQQISAVHETLPFTVRALDKKTAKLGILELYRTGLVDAYPVLAEKPNEFVAHIKTTVFITKSSVDRVTQGPVTRYASEKSVQDEEIKKLLAQSLKIKKKSKKGAASGMDMSD